MVKRKSQKARNREIEREIFRLVNKERDDSIKETMKKTEETLKRLEEEEKWKQMGEERNNYPLMPKPEIEQEEHVLSPDEIIKLTGSHEPVKEEKEDFDSRVKQEAVKEEEKEESKEEGTKRMKEELEGKLEGTTYSDLQNVNITNIPKEEVMPGIYLLMG